jgi:hypothetical protein
MRDAKAATPSVAMRRMDCMLFLPIIFIFFKVSLLWDDAQAAESNFIRAPIPAEISGLKI